MKALTGLLTALAIPVMILNILGGIVAGIWLAILGQWGTIGAGILIFLVSTWLLGFVIMPSMLLVASAALCEERGKTFGFISFVALGNLYVLAVITIWCCGILFFFVQDATEGSIIPRLLWSYGLATGPWAYMAGKDAEGGGGDASMLGTFLAQLAYITTMILVLFTPITLLTAVKVFAGFMAVALVIQITFAILIQKELKASKQQSPC